MGKEEKQDLAHIIRGLNEIITSKWLTQERMNRCSHLFHLILPCLTLPYLTRMPH